MTTKIDANNITLTSFTTTNLNVSAVYANNYYYANGTPFSGGGGGASTPSAISDQLNTSTGYLSVPIGNTEQRSANTANGGLRYNTTTYSLETFINNVWISLATNAPYAGINVSYLVVAGGGGGGGGTTSPGGAGGGAGGYRTSDNASIITLFKALQYPVIIGAGGSGGAGAAKGANGSISAIQFANGVAIIESAGGGGGGYYTSAGNSGGSGGGAAFAGTKGLGNTPSTTPAQGYDGGTNSAGGAAQAAAGGGGASGAGGNSDGSVGGTGGLAGLSLVSAATVTINIANSTISSPFTTANNVAINFSTTGSLPTGLLTNTAYWVVQSTGTNYKLSSSKFGSAISLSGTQSGTHTANQYFAGGGGGGAGINSTKGTSGYGAGDGGATGLDGQDAVINTGGGGGGAGENQGGSHNGGAGSSGVVIISYPSTQAEATTTGNVEYALVGSTRVYKFSSTGSIVFN